MEPTSSNHYDKKYFLWQSSIGEFGGWANLTKFQDYIKPSFKIIDFGCGGGYLLKNIDCKEKVGIEVNESARQQAKQLGIKTYATIEEINDEWADLIISNNVLEHCLNPLQDLKNLYPKLKHGGRIVFVVPCESINHKYVPNNISHHLYCWSPMSLGNLFTEAGFVVEESRPYIHKWRPKHRKIAKYGGRGIFEIYCRIYGHLERSWFQVRIIARKLQN